MPTSRLAGESRLEHQPLSYIEIGGHTLTYQRGPGRFHKHWSMWVKYNLEHEVVHLGEKPANSYSDNRVGMCVQLCQTYGFHVKLKSVLYETTSHKVFNVAN